MTETSGELMKELTKNERPQLSYIKYISQPVEVDVYFDLKNKVEENKELQETYKDYNCLFGIFSKSGFTPRLEDVAKENQTLLLIDKDEIK